MTFITARKKGNKRKTDRETKKMRNVKKQI